MKVVAIATVHFREEGDTYIASPGAVFEIPNKDLPRYGRGVRKASDVDIAKAAELSATQKLIRKKPRLVRAVSMNPNDPLGGPGSTTKQVETARRQQGRGRPRTPRGDDALL